MAEKHLIYQDLFNEMDRIKNNIYDACGIEAGNHKISEMVYDTNLYDLLLKFKEFEFGIERDAIYDKYHVLNLKEEVMQMILMQKNLFDNSFENIIKIDINPSKADNKKEKIANELENSQMMFSNGFFMVAALRYLFNLKKDINKIDYGCSELTDYFNGIESRKYAKEYFICLNNLSDFIKSNEVQFKLTAALKKLYPHLADQKIELYLTFDESYSRRDYSYEAGVIMRIVDEHCSVMIGNIIPNYFNLTYSDEFKDNIEKTMIRNAIFENSAGMFRYDIRELMDDNYENTKKKVYVDKMIETILNVRKNIDKKIKQYGQ